MKKTTQDQYVTCTNLKRPKTYEVSEAKEKPGFAICPVCGEYHKLNSETPDVRNRMRSDEMENDLFGEYRDKALTLRQLNDDVRQSVYVLEEMAELQKELMKKVRGKENHEAIIEEACDVVCTTLSLLYTMGVSNEQIARACIAKTDRAIRRIEENGQH